MTPKNQFKETFSHASLTNCYVYVCHMVCKWWAKAIITACIPITHIIKLWKPPDFLKANIEKRWLGSQQGIKYVCLLISLHTLSEKYVGKQKQSNPMTQVPHSEWEQSGYMFLAPITWFMSTVHTSVAATCWETLYIIKANIPWHVILVIGLFLSPLCGFYR